MRAAILVAGNLEGFAETSGDHFELEEQMSFLLPAFQAAGITLETVRWQEAAERAGEFDAMLPLLVWDYVEADNLSLFKEAMAQVTPKTLLLNPLPVIEWNGHKGYLDELRQLGAPTIPTIRASAPFEASVVEEAFTTFQCDQIVIKPAVGANSWRQVLLRQGDPLPSQSELPPGEALIQPFLTSVKDEGEFSFVYFDGTFSHALRKVPRSGDYRIQPTYGGTQSQYHPTEEDKALVESILQLISFGSLLYVRVDLLRGNDGLLKLIELEMIEPFLYLATAPTHDDGFNRGAWLLASALRKRISDLK
jgi:hypothetical protein